MIEQADPMHVEHGGGTTYRARGGFYTLVSPATRTGGAYSLWEGLNPPGTGVPPHIQHREDESFYILEGCYAFWTAEGARQVGPGEYLLAPRGTPHGFQNDGPAQARLLIVQSPGGIHEQYFAEAWEVVDDPSNLPPEPEPDFAKIRAAAERAAIELLPPR
jgi:mannose-6-phosphate isomerase-like protein (cupin superfamily)